MNPTFLLLLDRPTRNVVSLEHSRSRLWRMSLRDFAARRSRRNGRKTFSSTGKSLAHMWSKKKILRALQQVEMSFLPLDLQRRLAFSQTKVHPNWKYDFLNISSSDILQIPAASSHARSLQFCFRSNPGGNVVVGRINDADLVLKRPRHVLRYNNNEDTRNKFNTINKFSRGTNLTLERVKNDYNL